MKIIFFSSSMDTTEEWIKRENNNHTCISFYDIESLEQALKNESEYILVIDYDTVAFDFNKLLSANTLPQNTIVLERTPEIVTGKMLISHGVKAYGNSRMMTIHYKQMLQAVMSSKVWTYPELTAALIKETKKPTLSEESQTLLEKRLSTQEKKVVYLILEGLTNDAIAQTLEITTRTVKAHVSSIFSKLHINDRLSLVLLLK